MQPAALTAAMAQVPDLRVMAASTMARYRGRAVDPQVVGRELGVATVLTGRLVRRGNLVVIDTELVDVTHGTRLWGARLERARTDLPAVQEEITREIATGLHLRLTGQTPQRDLHEAGAVLSTAAG